MSLAAAVLAPVFAQIVLTFALMFMMAVRRMRDFRSGVVRPQEIALGERKWSEQTTKVANCFANQFEIPVLFYVLTALQWTLGAVDQWTIGLAWAFVISRYIHAAEFTTSNIVMRRGAIFGLGAMIILADWILLAVRVFSS